MNLTKASVLITGGSQGIGLGLARRFLAAGSKVLITGRDLDKLQRVTRELPGLLIYANDISKPGQRETLAAYIRDTLPSLNILINNAGFQRRISLASDNAAWTETQNEIDTLLAAPIHLNHLLIPVILSTANPGLIVNVTSGGAYIPQVFAPVYSSCKAALHSYTMVLRHALKDTSCRVIELIPPAVQTGLAGPGLTHGALVDEFCDAIFPKLLNQDITEVGYGSTENLIPQLSGQPLAGLFDASALRFPVETYAANFPKS